LSIAQARQAASTSRTAAGLPPLAPCTGQASTSPPPTMASMPSATRRSTFSRNANHASSAVSTPSRLSKLEALDAGVRRATRLVEQLLTLEQLGAEAGPPAARVPLAQVVGEVLAGLEPLAEAKRITLTLKELDPVKLRGQAQALHTLVRNLVDNAINYTPSTPERPGLITVRVLADPFGHVLLLQVEDDGPGIAEADLPRIFERFYRVDKARSRELGGTGLGLSIVKHLVAAHSGTARVESRLNEGSTFFFTLPLDEPALSQEQLNLEFTAS